MINAAIICEYNPFHNGHKIQIGEIKKRFYETGVRIICLMSGNFVERGDIACADKYGRARLAVENGADLVIELPYPFSMLGAEGFAGAAIRILNGIGGIDCLFFGSEGGSVGELTEYAEGLLSEDFEKSLTAALADGKQLPYAFHRSDVYEKMYGKKLPATPNDILGVEYIKALIKTGSHIKPFVIKRHAGYSAAEARRALEGNDKEALSALVPENTAAYFKSRRAVAADSISSFVIPMLRMANPRDFDNIYALNTDLAARLIKGASSVKTVSGLTGLVSDKKYTRSRVRRAILSMVFGITREDASEKPCYTTVLAMNEKGRGFLSERRKSEIIICTRRAELRSNANALAMFDRAQKAESIYSFYDEIENGDYAIVKIPFIIK